MDAPKTLRTLREIERDSILEMLNYCEGNRTHAARLLGISIRCLRNKLREYAPAGAFAAISSPSTASHIPNEKKHEETRKPLSD